MSSPGEFSVATAGVILLAAIAASALATAIALGHGARRSGSAAAVSVPGAGPLAPARKTVPSMPETNAPDGGLPETEIEYQLDTSEPPSPTQPP